VPILHFYSILLPVFDNSVCQGVSDMYLSGLEILILTHCFPSEWGWNFFVNDSFLLRCICKIAKSGCWLCHDCPSFFAHGTALLPLDGFLWNL